MDDFTLMRLVHILAVTLWIGGVGFVTLVVMPVLRVSAPAEDRFVRFAQFEHRFARQARVWVLLAGASGVWMIWRADLWSRFTEIDFWWMHLMVAVWTVFALMLFVIEPMHQHRSPAQETWSEARFVRMTRLHQLLLLASVCAILGAVGGSHGIF